MSSLAFIDLDKNSTKLFPDRYDTVSIYDACEFSAVRVLMFKFSCKEKLATKNLGISMKNVFSKTKVLLLSSLLVLGLFSTSCGKGGSSASNVKIPGVSTSAITLNNDSVLISFVFDQIQLDGGLRYNIPKYPNSYLEISPDLQTSGTLMSINIAIKDVAKAQVQGLDPQALPGGRALPGVATGRLPAVAFTIEKFHGMGVYVGPKLFGVFIPLKNLGIGSSIITARYYAGANRVGNISLVGADANGENSGILLMLDLSSSVAQTKLLTAK